MNLYPKTGLTKMDATQERRRAAAQYSEVWPSAIPTGMKPAAVMSVPASIGFAQLL